MPRGRGQRLPWRVRSGPPGLSGRPDWGAGPAGLPVPFPVLGAPRFFTIPLKNHTLKTVLTSKLILILEAEFKEQ